MLHHVLPPASKQRRRFIAYLVLILLIAFVAHSPALRNGFTNWDDEAYVVYNPLIVSFSLKTAGTIFTTMQYMGGYTPITLLSYAAEYHVAQTDPQLYHLDNLVLHLLNTALVAVFILLVTSHLEVSLISALLFGIHPFHAEAVAWISSRKDLLFAFFYLCALISYSTYSTSGRKRVFYFVSLAMFLCSLLSKAMAVTLPVVLLLVDFLEGRKLDRRALIEKIPFFALGLVVGAIGAYAQYDALALEPTVEYTRLDRILVSSYAFVQYNWKSLVPTHLSAFYPFPPTSAGVLPDSFWIFPAVTLLILFIALFSLQFTRKVFFGIFFFGITVVLVLQIVPVGKTLMADRWSYLPLVGFCYLMAEGYSFMKGKLQGPYPAGARIVSGLLAAVMIWFCVLTWQRCTVWFDSVTMWTNVLAQFDNIPDAYRGGACAYVQLGSYDDAMRDYEKAVELAPQEASGYIGRGNVHMRREEYAQAVKEFSSAISFDPGNALAYYNRGTSHGHIEQIEAAVADFSKSIEIKADYADAYINRGIMRLRSRDTSGACADFSKAAALRQERAAGLIERFCWK